MGSRLPLQKRTRGKAQGINQLGKEQIELLSYISKQKRSGKASKARTDRGVPFYRSAFLGHRPSPSESSAITKRLKKLEDRGFISLYSDSKRAHPPNSVTHVMLTKLGKEAVRHHERFGASIREVEKAIKGLCYAERQQLKDIKFLLANLSYLDRDKVINLLKEEAQLTKHIKLLEDTVRYKLETASPGQRQLMVEVLLRYRACKEEGVQREFILPNPFASKSSLLALFD